MTFGERLCAARKAAGLTQEALAEQLGVSRQAVAKWEGNKANPDTANLFKLSQLLGITIKPLDLQTENTAASPPAAKPAAYRRLYIALLFAVYVLLMLALCCFAGVVPAVLLALVLLLAVLVAALHGVSKGRDNPRAAIGSIAFVLLGAASCALLWCAGFSLSAQYSYSARWGIDPRELMQHSQLSSFVQQCRAKGDGIYIMDIDLPGEGVQRCCFIYRCGVGSSDGKITAEPLRYRFNVRYSSDTADYTAADTLDIIKFSGQRDYQVRCLADSPPIYWQAADDNNELYDEVDVVLAEYLPQ